MFDNKKDFIDYLMDEDILGGEDDDELKLSEYAGKYLDYVLDNLALCFMNTTSKMQYYIWMAINKAVLHVICEEQWRIKISETFSEIEELAILYRKYLVEGKITKQTKNKKENEILQKYITKALPNNNITIENIRANKSRANKNCPIIGNIKKYFEDYIDLEDS